MNVKLIKTLLIQVVNSAASAAMKTESTTPGGEVDNYEVESYGDGPVAAAQIYPDEDYEEYDYDEDVDFEDGPAPHVCLNSNWKNYSSSICKVYDKKMNEIVVSVSGISGHTGANGDEMCHYPLNGMLFVFNQKYISIFIPKANLSSNIRQEHQNVNHHVDFFPIYFKDPLKCLK